MAPDRWGDTFETFNLSLNPGMGDAFAQCRAVAEGSAWCSFMAGDPGNGKTHLAIAALNAFGRGRFWKVPDFLDWLKHWAFDEGYELDVLLKAYREQDFLLVLDDLGVENQTDWAHEQLYRVLDARYERKLPTIVTTNQSLRKIDGRIASRYASGLVPCKGADLRRVK